MPGDMVLAIAVVASVAGVGVLRLAWSRARRSMPLNAVGWGLLLVGFVAGWIAAGAWGSSVAALWAMGAAFVALAWSALTAPKGRAPASNRRVGMLPEGNEPRRIGGRLLTFLLVGVVAVLPSVGAALAIGKLGGLLGWSAANAVATALFAMPVIWGLIAYAMLMETGRKGQLKVLALSTIPTWPALAAGLLT